MRVLAAAVILCALSALVLPITAGAAGGACAMACCLQKHVHSEEACEMHRLAPIPKRIAVRDPDDPLCGAPAPVTPENTESITIVAEPSGDENNAPDPAMSPAYAGQHSITAVGLFAPCRTECGAGVSASSQSRQQRDPVVSQIPRLHGPVPTLLGQFDTLNSVAVRNRTFRLSVPRGPPTALQA